MHTHTRANVIHTRQRYTRLHVLEHMQSQTWNVQARMHAHVW